MKETGTMYPSPNAHRASFLRKYPKSRLMEFKVLASTTTITGEVDVWHVLSSGKRATVIRYLFLKWLYDELTSVEFQLVCVLPEFFSSEEFVASVRTLASGVPKKVIRTRLNKWRILRGIPPHTREQYQSMKQCVRISIGRIRRQTRPTEKYSGWARHHNDHGSLGRILTEPTPVEFSDRVEIDLFIILSVGKVKFLGYDFDLSPDDDSKESKRSQ